MAPTTVNATTTLTHIAMPVEDFDAMVEFYERYTDLRAIHSRTNAETGLRTVWFANPQDVTDDGARFVIVFLEKGNRPPAHEGAENPYGFLTSVAHFGISTDSREAVDRIAKQAEADGCLVLGPVYRNEITGYIAMVRDPSGNNLEFSYGQELG